VHLERAATLVNNVIFDLNVSVVSQQDVQSPTAGPSGYRISILYSDSPRNRGVAGERSRVHPLARLGDATSERVIDKTHSIVLADQSLNPGMAAETQSVDGLRRYHFFVPLILSSEIQGRQCGKHGNHAQWPRFVVSFQEPVSKNKARNRSERPKRSAPAMSHTLAGIGLSLGSWEVLATRREIV